MPSISCGDSSIDARLDALLREGVAFSLLSLAFETRVEFRGEVSHAPRGGGVSFTGLARLSAPFELEAAIDLWVDAAGGFELRFALPGVAAMFDTQVRPRLAAAARARFDALVRPYQLALAGAAVRITGAGCSFARGVRLDQVTPTRELCRSFPAASLEARSALLTLACPPGPGFVFAISGGLDVAATLGGPAVTLERLDVRVDQDSRDLFVDASCRFTLFVGDDRIACEGGLEEQGGVVSLLGRRAGGVWEQPFGTRGLALTKLAVQVLPGKPAPQICLAGDARLGDRDVDADLALSHDASDPSRAVLRVLARAGLDLGDALGALIGPSLVPTATAGLQIRDLMLHTSRHGGSMTGVGYGPGLTIGGQIELWGLHAAVSGQFTASGGCLSGAMSPVRLPNDLPLVALTGAGEAGPSVRIECTPTRQSAEIDVALKIVGRYNHSATAVLERDRLYLALARTRLGVYSGGSFELTRGRGALRCEAHFDADMKVMLGRTALHLELAVLAAISGDAEAQRLEQRAHFDFDACGQRLRLAQRVEVRFDEVESVAMYFLQQDRAVAELIGGALRSAASAAIAWLRGHIDDAQQIAFVLHDVGSRCEDAAAALRDAFQLTAEVSARTLRMATYAPAAVASALASTYQLGADQVGVLLDKVGMSPSEVATAMRGAFDWSAKHTARFLDETLHVGDKAAKQALEAAGYSASQVKGAMEDVYGWTTSMWDSFVDLF